MTPGARLLAVVVALVGVVFAAAALVREVIVAAGLHPPWELAAWWGRITDEPSSVTGLCAAVAAAAAVAFIALAALQVVRRRRGPDLVDFAGDRGWARVDVVALERSLRRRVEAAFPGVAASGLSLAKEGDAWRARLLAQVPARDLRGVRLAITEVLAADLARLGGLRLAGVDLVVTRLLPSPADASAER